MCYSQENGQAKTISPSKLSEILNVSKPQAIPCWSLNALLELLGDGNWNITHTIGLENLITITYKFWDTVIVKHGKDLIDVVVDLICEVYKKRG